MTKQQMIEYCLQYADVYEDYPFDENWATIRHTGNGKIFAFVYELRGKLYVNLKTNPELGFIWRQTYPFVLPAYHMNKQHWITVDLSAEINPAVLSGFVNDSYTLTKPKRNSKL